MAAPGMKVLIVGGGPVGLFTAYQFLKNSSNTVEVLEKRELKKWATRTPAIALQPDVLEHFDKKLLRECAKLTCVIHSQPAKASSLPCYRQVSSKRGVNIRTIVIGDLEKCLRKTLEKNKSFTMLHKDQTSAELEEYIAKNHFELVIAATGGRTTWVHDQIKAKSKEHATCVGPSCTPESLDQYGVVAIGAPATEVKRSKHHEVDTQHDIHGFLTRKGDIYLGMVENKEAFLAQKAKGVNGDPTPHTLERLHKALEFYGVKKGSWPVKWRVSAFGISPLKSYFPLTASVDGVRLALIGDNVVTPHFMGGQGINNGFRSAVYLAKCQGPRMFNLLKYDKFIKKLQSDYIKKTVDVFGHVSGDIFFKNIIDKTMYFHMSYSQVRHVLKNMREQGLVPRRTSMRSSKAKMVSVILAVLPKKPQKKKDAARATEN